MSVLMPWPWKYKNRGMQHLYDVKSHIFNAKFVLKSLTINCHRSACRVHAFLKIDHQQRKFQEVVSIKNNQAVFNCTLNWDSLQVGFQELSATYHDKFAVLSLVYETLDQGSASKLKIGEVSVNLGKILNDKIYCFNNEYSLEKCYDQSAKLKLLVDLAKLETDPHSTNGQARFDEWKQLHHNSDWRTSKIRERMLDQEKNMIQNKLQECEDKLSSARSEHDQQMRRNSEQMDLKDQKISHLSSENNSLRASVHNLQLSNQKCKNQISVLENQTVELKQNLRVLGSERDQLHQKHQASESTADELRLLLSQAEKARSKREEYYKQEMQRYNKRYLDAESARNLAVLQMEARLKEEEQRRDLDYKQAAANLQQRSQESLDRIRSTLAMKEQELLQLAEDKSKLDKEVSSLKLRLEEKTNQVQSIENVSKGLQEQMGTLQLKFQELEAQHEIAIFSSSNLDKEIRAVTLQNKTLTTQVDDLKYEIELANHTIEENDQTLIKLTRQIQTHKEREFYMESKYQDDLEAKTYNESCMRGSNNHFRQEIRKLATKIRLLEQKAEEDEERMSCLSKEKEKLEAENKRCHQVIFENSHQNMQLESELRNLKHSLLEATTLSDQQKLRAQELEKRNQKLAMLHESDVKKLSAKAKDSEQKLKEAHLTHFREKQEWKTHLNSNSEAKNSMPAVMETELTKYRAQDRMTKQQMAYNLAKIQQLESQLHNERQSKKEADLELQLIRAQVQQMSNSNENLNKELSNTRRELSTFKSQVQEQSLSLSLTEAKTKKMKDTYAELVNWVVDRVVTRKAREYIQKADPEVSMELIHHVNNALQRVYKDWDSLNKELREATTQKEEFAQQFAQLKIQFETQKGNCKDDYFDEQFEALTRKIAVAQPVQHPACRDSFDLSREADMQEELRREIRKLQQDLSRKNLEISRLEQDLQAESKNTCFLKEEIRDLKEQTEDLRRSLASRNSQIRKMQTQGQSFDESIFPNRSLHNTETLPSKSQIESRHKDSLAKEEMGAKYQEALRQSELDTAKIQVIEAKLENSNQTISSLQAKIAETHLELQSKEVLLRKACKDKEQQEKQTQNLVQELQVCKSKLVEKDKQREELSQHCFELTRNNEALSQQMRLIEARLTQKNKQTQAELSEARKSLSEANSAISDLKISAANCQLELQSRYETVQYSLKEAQAKAKGLGESLSRNKEEYSELYDKYTRTVGDLSEAQECRKDAEMAEGRLQQKIVHLTELLQNKQFEYEQLKFTSESRIIQLSRELEELSTP